MPFTFEVPGAKGLGEQIAENGRLMAQAALAGVPTNTPRVAVAPRPNIGGFTQGQATGLGIVFTLSVLMPMAFAAARLMWKRGNRPAAPPGWTQAAPKLENLEQAVDTIAVEMERVSEGQRYLTRLLSERQAIGAGPWAPAEPFPLPEREPVPVRREQG